MICWSNKKCSTKLTELLVQRGLTPFETNGRKMRVSTDCLPKKATNEMTLLGWSSRSLVFKLQ